ncbi:hypothetical protein MTBBW1_2560002 [Desulfamplus magnetovallimortis]|uniref:Radical SAM core domain-containing protein n=1 Tax=Desulfamplus magnetovallimortis TaxID=1246637 RepID=A0A1W1HEN4_9BACT|nr:radical SAM/SPASM domain-containing protein [Desulfamplus magnetovallimortis]SLM30961.1 hypothetical protein MTBBW1_2560002 [Desulfamplus magnetovallimortis]
MVKISTIYVETSSKCNLSCSYCYRTSHDYESKNHNMPIVLFNKLISDFKINKKTLFRDSSPDIFLHGYGEPTLNPNLDKMVKTASDAKIFNHIRFVSNLQALPLKKYHRFFNMGLTGLYISLDCVTPDTKIDYNQTDYGQINYDQIMINNAKKNIRTGTNLNKLMANISKLSESFADKLYIISVLTPDNFEEISRIGDFLQKNNILVWNIQLLNNRREKFSLNPMSVSKLKAKIQKKFSNMQINFEEESLLKCNQPFTTLMINSLGYFTPCCSMTNHEIIHFGNAGQKSAQSICFGEKYESFRQEFKKQRPRACEKCPYYP